jgi:aryl-alcohol dehydrogenase-like predicted oxidoreductase
MQRRRLGDSDLEVSCVGFGAWAIGGLMWGGCDADAAVGAVRAALDAGVDWVDTAPAYGCGRSEELVGRALRGRRDPVCVATKCGLRWDRADGALRFDVEAPGGGRVRIYHNLRPDSLREECEASLRRLGVERIDLYQIHWPYPPHPLDEACEALLRLREEGKVRALGVSNFSRPELARALASAGIVSLQSPYSLLDRRIESELLPWCREHALGVLAYSPMGRGLLGGKIDPQTRFPASDHRHANPAFAPEQRARVQAALARARPLARAHGVSLANLAVAWVLGEPGVTAALVGARDAEQARENARAAELRLGADERAELAAIFPALPWTPVAR